MHLLIDAFRGLFGFLFELAFHKICGWIGHITVKVLTFGKVEIDWGDSSESILAEMIGVGVLLGLAALVWTSVA